MKPVVSCAAMRAADKYTIERLCVSSQELMERAGAAIAEETAALLRRTGGHSVLAVCGGGNNGGDGWCAARLLAAQGFETAVFTLTDKLSPDCAAQRERYEGEVLTAFPDRPFDAVIDAVFGTGFRGTPEGKFEDAIARINACGAKVVSADIPSGLDGDNGLYASCVHADLTVTIGTRKSGLYLQSGADMCGEIVCRDIGIRFPAPPEMGLCEASDFAPLFPPRKRNTNKGSYGKAVLLAGSLRYSGAAFLSAQGALRAGCGYTVLAVPQDLFPHCVGKLPAAILTAAPAADGTLCADESFLQSLCDADSIAVGMGCGASRGVYDCVCYLLSEYAGTLIVDADGLNALARYGADVLREKRCRVVLTPHPKEFSRLCGAPHEEVLKNGLSLAAKFAREYGVTVLLKGNTSTITNGRQIWLNAEGTPALAKGGSGDVLAGIIAAVAARKSGAMQAAACGAFLLGRAGTLAAAAQGNEYSVTAEDVAAMLPQAIAQVAAGEV